MTKYNKKIFASILAAVIAVGMFGCSQKNEQESSGQTTQETSDESGVEENTSTTDVSFSRSNEEIAKDFCTVWADKWAQIEEEGVTSNQQGRAFLEDMDNDGAKELIFLYDNDVNFNAVVYRISGDKTEELGTFVLSNTSPELNFTVYQGENGVILKHVAVRELTSETQNETEESYIMMEDGKVLQEILFSTTYDGVDVRIITPHIADKWYVHAVSRAHYEILTEAGVKIYEYTPGFIHAKTFVVDDDYAVVGTINLDYRSLYLHFECAAWMYQTDSVAAVKEDFFKTQQLSQEITLEECRKVSFVRKLGRSVLRVFAPLM